VTGQHDTETVLLTVEILLGEVSIRHRIAHQNNGIALVDNLDRLVVASNDGEDVVIHHKIGGTGLMALRHSHNRGAIELTIVAHVVQLVLSTLALDALTESADSLLGANDGGGLAASSSLNVGDELKQLVLVISASSGEVRHAAKLISGSALPKIVNIIQHLLTEGVSDLLDKHIEVNTTGQNAIELLINAHGLHGRGDRGLAHAAEALTTDSLSAIGNLRNDEQLAVLNEEQVLVAFGNIAEVNESVEIFILFC